MKLLIINGSVRQARASGRVVKWVEANVGRLDLGDVECQTIDLRELSLPMFDEPVSPMANKDRHPSGNVKVWLEALASADGLIIVTPEYNHAMPGGLNNAIDYIDHQVDKKPFMVVGHGGAGGARAVEQVKLTLNSNLGAVPVPNSVGIVGYVGPQELISEDGIPTEHVALQEGPLERAVKTLVWYAQALKSAREN